MFRLLSAGPRRLGWVTQLYMKPGSYTSVYSIPINGLQNPPFSRSYSTHDAEYRKYNYKLIGVGGLGIIGFGALLYYMKENVIWPEYKYGRCHGCGEVTDGVYTKRIPQYSGEFHIDCMPQDALTRIYGLCEGCGKAKFDVFAQTIKSGETKKYHPKCIPESESIRLYGKCELCQKSLMYAWSIKNDSKGHSYHHECAPDYLLCPRCPVCGELNREKLYHSVCGPEEGRPLDRTGQFRHEACGRDDHLYKKCDRCQKATHIDPEWKDANENSIHFDCLTNDEQKLLCKRCHKIGDLPYTQDKNGFTYHLSCLRRGELVCTRCNKLIFKDDDVGAVNHNVYHKSCCSEKEFDDSKEFANKLRYLQK